MFKNQNVLVTGGSGMIGRQLVNLLLEKGAKVYVADLNEPINMPSEIIFKKEISSATDPEAKLNEMVNVYTENFANPYTITTIRIFLVNTDLGTDVQ
jgi:NAD(P)-dependent dehydrogenase (short-subunit alcohol dehydrogenase family)